MNPVLGLDAPGGRVYRFPPLSWRYAPEARK